VVAIRPLSEGGIEESAILAEGISPEVRHLAANVIGPDYFKTAGTRLLSGREFSRFDTLSAPPTCILNKAAATFLFPLQSALGGHIRSTQAKPLHPPCDVVGIVADAKYQSLRQPAPPTLYLPYQQLPGFDVGGFILRSHDVGAAVSAFRDTRRRLAPDTPLLPSITMQRQIEDSVGQERLLAALSVFLGCAALFLTCIGLYGLESQQVRERSSEIGVRLALGAQCSAVVWTALRRPLTFLLAGICVGLGLAVGASKFISGVLYQTSALDVRFEAAAVLVFLAVGFAAAYLPARKAARIDPMITLRYE
jgi:putative ABC transport system permease protein